MYVQFHFVRGIAVDSKTVFWLARSYSHLQRWTSWQAAGLARQCSCKFAPSIRILQFKCSCWLIFSLFWFGSLSCQWCYILKLRLYSFLAECSYLSQLCIGTNGMFSCRCNYPNSVSQTCLFSFRNRRHCCRLDHNLKQRNSKCLLKWYCNRMWYFLWISVWDTPVQAASIMVKFENFWSRNPGKQHHSTYSTSSRNHQSMLKLQLSKVHPAEPVLKFHRYKDQKSLQYPVMD